MADKKTRARKAIIDIIWSGIEARTDYGRFNDKDDDLMDEIEIALNEIEQMWKKK